MHIKSWVLPQELSQDFLFAGGNITYEAKRLYGKYVSVRDYVVQKAIDQAEDLIIWFEGQHMVVSLPTLESRIKKVSRPLKSKWKKDQEYTLMNFTWRPVIENPDQVKMF